MFVGLSCLHCHLLQADWHGPTLPTAGLSPNLQRKQPGILVHRVPGHGYRLQVIVPDVMLHLQLLQVQQQPELRLIVPGFQGCLQLGSGKDG